MNARRYALGLAGITLLGGVARFLYLTAGSVWLDEVYTMVRSAAPFGELFRPSTYDANPPFAYLLYKGWTGLFGTSEWSYEVPAALFGIAAILATSALAGRLFDRSTSLLAALLLSVSVAHIDVSQTIRSYSFGVLVAVLAVHSLCVFLDGRSRRSGAALGATCLMLIYSHYAGVFVVFSLFLFAFLYAWRSRREALRPLLVVSTLIGLGFAPTLYDIYIQYTEFVSFSWIASLSLDQALSVVKMFHSRSSVYFACAGTVLVAAGVSRRGLLLSGSQIVLLFWLLVPIGVVLVLSVVGRPLFLSRYFVFLLPAYAIVLARCIAKLPRPSFRVAATCVLLLASVLSARDYYLAVLGNGGREAAARFVEDRFQPGDIILHTSFYEFLPTWHFYHRRRFPEHLMAQARSDHIDRFWPSADIVQDKAVFETHDRIWVMGRGLPEEQLQRVLKGQRFRDHQVELVFRPRPSTVFLLQRCPETGCGGMQPREVHVDGQ